MLICSIIKEGKEDFWLAYNQECKEDSALTPMEAGISSPWTEEDGDNNHRWMVEDGYNNHLWEEEAGANNHQWVEEAGDSNHPWAAEAGEATMDGDCLFWKH